MRDTHGFLVAVLLLTLAFRANSNELCSESSDPIYFSGAPSVQAVAQAWKLGYEALCPNADIDIQGNSSADGAARVCATRTGAIPVEIGGISRQIYTAEAKTENGWQYDCERSRRNAIKVDVAVEGISLFVKQQGAAQKCIQILGGLTMHQLRWMFSNYSESMLIEEGWDSSSVPFSDGNQTTHLWSELHSNCDPEEILITGEPEGSLVRKYFVDNIFEGDDEGIATNRNASYFASENIPELVEYVELNPASITFFGLGYTLQSGIRESLGALESVPIRNSKGDFTKPGFAAIEDSSYLLSRRLYMLVWNDEESLSKTRPFFEFGYSETGSKLLKENGFWPIHHWEQIVMQTRLQTSTGGPLLERAKRFCGPRGGKFSIAGSSTVFPIARIWSEIYEIACDVDITYEGGGSSVGAGRVCAELDRGTPTDIGNMSREWKDAEANAHGNYIYECVQGDPDRSAIQIAVAIDGLTVAVQNNGIAARCIQLLKGLTMGQLRWVYSSYSEQELEKTGWDPREVPFTDNNPGTHLWSELDDRCDSVEILISGPDDLSGTYEYFKEEVLKDYKNGETFASNRGVSYVNSAVDELLIKYVDEHEEALTFFGYAYYAEYQNRLASVPIQNSEGAMIAPSTDTIRDGSYEPLSRSIYMNVLNEKASLKHVVPFIKFGLESDELVGISGYLAHPAEDEMHRRIDGAPYDLSSGDSGIGSGTLVGLVIGGAFLFVVSLLLAVHRSRNTKSNRPVEEQAYP